MYTVIWRYVVPPSHRDAFVSAYRPDGDWARLFSSHPGFIGVELVLDPSPGHFVTIDYWRDEHAWDDFIERYRTVYDQLDRRLGELTSSEELIARGTLLRTNPSTSA